ncbi:MAG: phenylacetate--CoA ligase family protein, partial [Betaproteobacteria bacterium]
WLEYESSGSTGEPIVVQGSELTNFFFGALALRNHLWHDHDLGAKLATIRTVVGDAALPSWGPALDVAFRTGPCVTLNIVADLDRQISWLLEQRPVYLLTHPSNLLALAREFERRELRLPGLREVWTFGEVLPADLRAACKRAWGVKLTDIYTAEEVGYIALQCPEQEHYHVQTENVLVEIIDQQGRTCRPGEIGRVVITTLHNFAMPLIRYANGDYAEAGEPCPCGRGLPVLRRIMGRQRNMVVLPDGSRHWPSFPVENWQSLAPIRQIQMVQQSLLKIEARVVTDRELTTDEMRKFKAALQTSLGYPFEIGIKRVPAIQRSPNLKFEDFVSEVSA